MKVTGVPKRTTESPTRRISFNTPERVRTNEEAAPCHANILSASHLDLGWERGLTNDEEDYSAVESERS